MCDENLIDDPDEEEHIKYQAAAVLDARQVLATSELYPVDKSNLPEPNMHLLLIGLGWKQVSLQEYEESHRQKRALYTSDQMQDYGRAQWIEGYNQGKSFK